jgi:glycosyltransferase involved in cell wall biosynthesis
MDTRYLLKHLELTMNKKISVIIPLYNKEKEIKRALDSILKQTYQNFEIIVVDDHSSDGGPAIVKNFSDPRIFLIEQDHRGVSYTRNHGITIASGEFIALLDADDEWTPIHLETIIRLIDQYPGAGMYATAYRLQTNEGETFSPNLKNIPQPPWEGFLPDYFKSGALGWEPVCSSTVVIPKKIFHEVGGFNEGYSWGEDMDLYGKIALKYPVAFSWEPGGIWHWDASNRIHFGVKTAEYIEEPFIATARSALKNQEVPPQFVESLKEYIAHRQIYRAATYMSMGSPDIARTILEQCETKWYYNKKITWLLLAKLPYPISCFLLITQKKITAIVRKK